ncbi:MULTISPECIES: glycosyltransferase family 2 protein [unclassified Acinetobacter]|uniref:glycosyltransferase family 2 protein n=1 Tax=unclassified Acinetobacter TaxID=196816 RepID=UPI001909249E|nr:MULTISPECIES: glycosyltransferase family 2 protein [unclassified Acinetobacter]MBK0062866.1 glycosyltransferase family 2 protein [Acinetobacter sp. S55]MBK0065557.1 glycosyltransferase family 2 protein [Acinetobacter sp. S54]
MKISIVLPAKNESGAIGQTIEHIQQLQLAHEIIVVNDGSTDHTQDVAEQAGAKVVSHPYSKGNGAAIKTGARTATGDVIVFMDADGQHDPQDIPRLLEQIEQGYDLVVGARQKGSQASVGRGVANALYNNLATYMTEQKVEDLTSGFRAVRADKFREFLYLLPNGFSYPTTSTMAFFRAGYSVTYVPIHAAKRIGKSHINPIKDGIRFFLIIFKIATLFSPLKMFLPIAVLLFLMATSWYVYTLYEYHRFTNMSALFYTGSIMIFLMGLISEQVTALMYKDSD